MALAAIVHMPASRQPDTERFRLWELPGASDVDTYLDIGPGDLGNSPDTATLLLTTVVKKPDGDPLFTCNAPINSGPQHFAVNAALAALDAWVREGVAPTSAPRIETADGQVLRGEYGNALGGVRTPQLDVPIATLNGTPNTGATFCFIVGNTVPFDAATLAALYPDHATYVAQFNAATDRAVAAGFILPPDAALMKTAAAESDIGEPR